MTTKEKDIRYPCFMCGAIGPCEHDGEYGNPDTIYVGDEITPEEEASISSANNEYEMWGPQGRPQGRWL